MAQMSHIYANFEKPFNNHNRRNREVNSSEYVFENIPIHDLKPNNDGAALSGADKVKRRSCKVAAVILLCLLLLAAAIILAFLCFEISHQNLIEENAALKRSIFDFETSHQNLTGENAALKRTISGFEISHQNLIEENAALKRSIFDFETSHQNLTEENAALKRIISDTEARCKNQAEERDKTERKLKTLGWVHFGDSLYYISSTKKTWQESRNYCIQEGADLMIINSKEEQTFTRQFKKFMWFGLTDAESEGTWKWVDGTPLARSFWGSGEPNGNTGENCGEIKNPDSDNNWNDEGCSISHFWICEKNFS
ncbi:C-type lectin domain family 4 member M-like isoform X1 [Toxotes jaculatrix]|uniref:C-type lectin domain family 4 member M-like isoform X1 n=1 Tax=Toxotes jaculatrix TaxID=941984 RepID=UPI001B3A9B48|nr:C-type lectin domain family 4 member M-like isoform X1 [Toxotes jaculatrix]